MQRLETSRLVRSFFAVGILSTLLPTILLSQASNFIFEARELPKGRGFHGSSVMGDYLYVFGGTSTTTPSDANNQGGLEEVDLSVIKAQIIAGGQLGEWENTTPLPKALHYIGASTIALNDVVYIVGGSSLPADGEYSNTAIWSKPLPDGTLMPWRESRPFGEKLSLATVVTTPGYIHMIGGLVDSQQDSANPRLPTAKIYSNNVFSDGTMSEWVEGNPLPAGLWFHSAGVAGGRVFVWGGVFGANPGIDTTSANVFSCSILSSGKLGPWRAEATLLSYGMYSASSAVAGPYLISFSPRYPLAGQNQIAVSSDVWWSYATPLGLIPWTREQTSLPNRVYHSITPDYRRGTIYLIGGRPEFARDFTNKVWYFTLSPAARSLAENQWAAAQLAHSSSVSTFDTLAQTNTSTNGQQGVDQLSYLADKRLAVGAVPGFLTISDARRIAGEGSKIPLVMYFNAESAVPCKEQAEILKNSEFVTISHTAAFAWVNSREYPQLAQQMGVYRVPTWVFFDRQGAKVKRVANIISLSEIVSTVASLQ